MEILRQGSTDKIKEWEIRHKRVYVLTCEVCDCEFEVAYNDPAIQYDQKEGESYVKCPFCHRYVDID